MGIADDFGDFESAVQDAANRGVSEAQDFIAGLSPEQSAAFQAQQEAQQAAQQAAEQAQADALWDSLASRYPNARNFGSRGTGNTFLDFLVKAAGGKDALLAPANIYGREQPAPPAVPTPNVTREELPDPTPTFSTLGMPGADPDLDYGVPATPDSWEESVLNAIRTSENPLSTMYGKYPAQFSGLYGTPVPDVAPPPESNLEVVDPTLRSIANQMYPKDKFGNFDIDKAKELGLPYADIVMDKDKLNKLQEDMIFGKQVQGGPVSRIEPPSFLEQGFKTLLTPIAVQVLNAIDRHNRTTTSPSRSDLVSDIPAQMPGYTQPTVSDLDPDSWESDGNVEAIRRFLQDPTYGNIPEIDPVSALAAYQNAIGGIDALVGERGFTGRGYAQAARDRAQGIFDEFQAGQDFDSMLNEKIGRAFADEALFNKDIELRGQGVQAVEQAFPQGFESDIFNPEAFSKVAENIYGQKLQGAQDIIARAGSRGQLSPTGGRLASESLLSQGPDVQSRLSDILGGVRSEAEGGLGGIRGSALEAAQGYKLGDELFDITPFESQASDYLSTTVGELPGRITSAVGTDPLFSAVSALQEGGRQQGQVSGTPSFLDVLAEREGGVGAGRDRRGLGSRGSGVF